MFAQIATNLAVYLISVIFHTLTAHNSFTVELIAKKIILTNPVNR